MNKTVWSCYDYSIKSVDVGELYELVAFVVKENYSHHSLSGYIPIASQNEIYDIYNEELTFASTSQYFIVYDRNEKIIGSIRVFKWDCKTLIPMQKIFKISPLEKIEASVAATFWHIGRFAIASNVEFSTLKLFKQLMLLAITPIIRESCSYMLAETDSHLLRVMNALGIETEQLGESIIYLSSETVPIYSSKNGLIKFYEKSRNLLIS